MLSVIHEPVPSCADFLEMAWLYDIGYRSMMLCDELCLKEDLLATAINACQSFREHYQPIVPDVVPLVPLEPARPVSRWRSWLRL